MSAPTKHQLDLMELGQNAPRLKAERDALEAENAELRKEQERLQFRLHRLTVAANSASYCYDKNPANFALALRELRDELAGGEND
jgi:predicted RNase H-like nuclease (RuvC/YqgF family)